MTKFERILNEVLKGWHVGDTTPNKSQVSNGFDRKTRSNSADAYHSIKYAKTISDQLTHLTHHNIIILIGNGLEKYIGGPSGRLLKKIDQTQEKALSKATNIPIADFENSFTIMIIGNQGQPKVSPWLILHQVGECLAQNIGDFWVEDIYPKYAKYFQNMPGINIPQNILQKTYGERSKTKQGQYQHPYAADAEANTIAFHHLFKMKSARELIHGEFDNIDPSQEIIVDYLWHGGKIRINQPKWLPNQIVKAIHNDITNWIERALNNLKGYRLVNEPQDVNSGDQFNQHIASKANP